MKRRNLLAMGAILSTVALARSKALAKHIGGDDDCHDGTFRGFGVPDTTNEPGCQCIEKGTPIATPDGYVPVETLKIGSVINTVDGPQPIIGMGYHKSINRAVQVGTHKGAIIVTDTHGIYMGGDAVIDAGLLLDYPFVRLAPTIEREWYNPKVRKHSLITAHGRLIESMSGPDVEPLGMIRIGFTGGRSRFMSHLRSFLAAWGWDIRKPVDFHREKLESRGFRV